MVDYHPFNDVMKDDPFPVYAQLRAESPVHYVEELDVWALARFEDVWNAGQNSELYPSPGPGLLSQSEPEPEGDDEAAGVGSIFGLNPPVHTKLRKQLTRHYSPGGVAKLEALVRDTARQCIDRAKPTGRLEVVTELGLQI